MSQRGFALVLIMLASLITAPADSHASPAAKGDASELEAVDAKFMAAFNRGDAAAIAALYAGDGVSMGPMGPQLWIKGRKAIQRDFEATFKQIGDLDLQMVEARYEVHGDVGWGVGLWTLTGKDKQSGERFEQRGRALSVYERHDGRWLYVADHASLVASPPPAAATRPKR